MDRPTKNSEFPREALKRKSATLLDTFSLHGGRKPSRNVRIVFEDEKDGTTRVSEDVWPKDEDSLFPLQRP